MQEKGRAFFSTTLLKLVFGGLPPDLPLPWKRWFPKCQHERWIITLLGHLSETLESLSPSKRTDLEKKTRRILVCASERHFWCWRCFVSPLSSRDDAVRTSSSSSSFMSLVSLTLSFTSNTNRRERERERKLCVSFDDDLLIYVVLHETITVFYAYTRRRGIDALLSRRCLVTRGFSHSFPLARSDDVVTQHRHHYSLSISHTPRSSLLLLTR